MRRATERRAAERLATACLALAIGSTLHARKVARAGLAVDAVRTR